MNRLLHLLKNLAAHGRPEVGRTPSDVVFTENKYRLLRYRPRPEGLLHRTPVLLVPSLINRHYVLDLLPGRSFVEFLVERGHDVFVIDWGTPGDEDRFLTFDTFCDRYIGRCVRRAAKLSGAGQVHLLGYCLGGTMAAIHAAIQPEQIASLIALAAPIRFADSGLLSLWTRTRSFDIATLVEAFGNVPWPLMQASFHLLRPTVPLQKAIQLYDKAEDERFLEGFLAVETWSNDNVSFPGACYLKYVEELYRRDALLDGTLTIGGRSVRLDAIRCPTLAITFEHDHIVPPESAGILLERVGASRRERIHQDGGHVGAVVSRRARRGLWLQVSEWMVRPGAGAEADPAATTRPLAAAGS